LCSGWISQPGRLCCLQFHVEASLPSFWDWRFAGTGAAVGENLLTYSRKVEGILTSIPNTSFQRILTRGVPHLFGESLGVDRPVSCCREGTEYVR